ncbi:MAG: conjugative transposon protein TraM [Mucilaginibacter sp.]|nr:conjugative transposon protein TraM [Mucilaginibacter sp.]
MEKQRKFFLVLPLLIIPFLTMAFWALGGGKSARKELTPHNGLDTDLPQAQFQQQERTDKMMIYQAAQMDSAKDGVSPAFLNSIGLNKAQLKDDSTVSPDEQAERIQDKLVMLHQRLEQPQSQNDGSLATAGGEPEKVKQINKMMRRANAASDRPDPEMQELNRMLDKIQAIQNPSSVRPEPAHNDAPRPFRAIPAMIDGKQRVADGAAVKLKLTDTATIKGQFLSPGQELYGFCQITNQRLLLTIQNIRLNDQIIPVNLVVYSQDGMPGIPAPEAELSGVTSSNADQTLQSMQLLSMDQSLGAQAAAGGINAAKDLFSKKVKKIKVKLHNEFPVLLKINR